MGATRKRLRTRIGSDRIGWLAGCSCSSGGSLQENDSVGQMAQSHATVSTFVGILAAPLSRSSPLKSQPAAAAGGLRADPTAAAAAPSSSPAPAVPSFSKRRVIRPTFLGEFHPQQAPSMPFGSALPRASASVSVCRLDALLRSRRLLLLSLPPRFSPPSSSRRCRPRIRQPR